MIIDKNKDQFAHLPSSAHGQVLLEENVSGFITCERDVFLAMKRATAQERADAGWGRYEEKIQSITEEELNGPIPDPPTPTPRG